MARIKINLTEDMLLLISNLRFQEVPFLETITNYDDEASIESTEEKETGKTWGLDLHSLYGGNFILEDISRILGIYDKHIEGTENDWLGPRFSDEDEEYMYELHFYIMEHICDIEEIIHQFMLKGGVKAGTYTCKPYEHIWKYKE